MKYKDLPKESLIRKLLATSFLSPANNLKVFNWADKVIKHIQFLENERIKLIRQYGEETSPGSFRVKDENMEEFSQVFMDLLNTEIEDDISKCPIQKEWFEDEKCCYPHEKEMWISPQEIGILLT